MLDISAINPNSNITNFTRSATPLIGYSSFDFNINKCTVIYSYSSHYKQTRIEIFSGDPDQDYKNYKIKSVIPINTISDLPKAICIFKRQLKASQR